MSQQICSPLRHRCDFLEDVAAEELQEFYLQLVLARVDRAGADLELSGDLLQLSAFGKNIEDGLEAIVERGGERFPVQIPCRFR